MNEQGKAAQRRSTDHRFTKRYFVGDGIDIGAGPDPFSKYLSLFPLVTSCRAWDVQDGDGTYLADVPDNKYDFVVSSHCLEHLDWPERALENWLRVVRPEGHVVIVVPDWEMYEREKWPSQHGVGHKHAYTTALGFQERPDHLLNVLTVIAGLPASLELVNVWRENFNPMLPVWQDQSLGPAECAIEFVLRKL